MWGGITFLTPQHLSKQKKYFTVYLGSEAVTKVKTSTLFLHFKAARNSNFCIKFGNCLYHLCAMYTERKIGADSVSED